MYYNTVPMSRTARRAFFRITPEVIQDIFTTGFKIPFDKSVEVVKGIPPNAVFKGAYFDYNKRLFVLEFEHESFPEVCEGDVINTHIVAQWQIEQKSPDILPVSN